MSVLGSFCATIPSTTKSCPDFSKMSGMDFQSLIDAFSSTLAKDEDFKARIDSLDAEKEASNQTKNLSRHGSTAGSRAREDKKRARRDPHYTFSSLEADSHLYHTLAVGCFQWPRGRWMPTIVVGRCHLSSRHPIITRSTKRATLTIHRPNLLQRLHQISQKI